MQILIAEDDVVTTMVVQKILEKAGHGVTVTKDGTEAWEAIQSVNFDLILMDWVLPNIDGLTLAQKTREYHKTKSPYLLLMSGKLGKEERVASFKSGINNFLLKPIDEIDLLVQLKAAERYLLMSGLLQKERAEKEKANKISQVVLKRSVDMATLLSQTTRDELNALMTNIDSQFQQTKSKLNEQDKQIYLRELQAVKKDIEGIQANYSSLLNQHKQALAAIIKNMNNEKSDVTPPQPQAKPKLQVVEGGQASQTQKKTA